MPYQDLREYLAALEAQGLIQWVDKKVDKQWEITSLTRRYFRKTDSRSRTALGFRNVEGYDIPVVVGIVGASRNIYGLAMGMEMDVQSIVENWKRGFEHPLEPVLVESGPCKEVILKGDDVDLHRFPIPVWTPEKDPNPFLTAGCSITKDPETGVRNVGVYRMEVKNRNSTGILWDLPSQHGALHYAKYEALKKPMPMATVIGGDPTIILGSVAKAPFGVDELAVAGGWRRKPIEMVRCETIDLEVPATAEIVLEGEIYPGERVSEGPFGEYTGYMGGPYEMPVFHIKCITHRRKPIYHALFSQMPPSESSLIRQVPEEANIRYHLSHFLKIPGIADIHLPESGGSYAWCWVSLSKKYPGQVQQVLCAAWTHYPSFAKWIVVTDDDIDIRDPFMREWVLGWRVEPKKDIFFIPNTSSILLDPSSAPPEVPLWDRLSSKICIDATKKWKFPELAVPPDSYLKRIDEAWDTYNLKV
jgi:4-hydroxy-3-polyprenylbenzoate decarboxylase